MALTQDQWYKKLKGWLPSWFFENERYQKAFLQAMAKVFSSVQENAEAHRNETFLSQAEDEFLDAHGDERGVERFSGEVDALYFPRVQKIVNTTPCFKIKEAVDAVLLIGECQVIEHQIEGPYLNRSTFFNRNFIFTDRRHYNHFTILIPIQNPVSTTFFSRESFLNRKEYIGAEGSLPAELILTAVNTAIAKSKALGISYRIIEGDF